MGRVGEATRVLVADSDEPTRNLVHLTFSGPGWEVSEADSVEAVVHALSAGVPHVLVLDADLPTIGGLAAARALRQQPQTAAVGILLVTDLTHPVSAGDLAESQVDAVIERPFGSFDLFEAVEELLQRP